jgi:alkanesulfonate monooxygenase SsuD/methylene tetrahydromethanopterin reductase-like flavin-dependent oxidoreductase (luciferase family)
VHIGYFVEQQYSALPQEAILLNGGFFGLPNKNFDRKTGAELYHRYIAEFLEAERVGFDSMCLNEHHANPACMSNSIMIEAAILAYASKRAKIVLLGCPLPITKNPLRAAEELAQIDLISGGRLVPGIIRGASWEQVASNTNPALNRELFEEAHDFILQAWTREGPWRYEGKHFHYRFVNPFVRPMQEKPQIWVPGVISPETVVWAAEHRYPYTALATEPAATARMWNLYGQTAARMGYQIGPENFGYFQKLIVADTDEEAYELGKGHIYGGSFTPTRFASLPGYNSKDAVRNYANKFYQFLRPSPDIDPSDVPALRQSFLDNYAKHQETSHVITGSPKTVIPKLRRILEQLRPGILMVWGPEGPVPHEKTMRMLELMGQEVLPALREIGKELDLEDPFQREPGMRPLAANGQWTSLVGENTVSAA